MEQKAAGRRKTMRLFVVDVSVETDSTGGEVATDTTNISLSLGVSVDHIGSVSGDGGAGGVVRSADLHALDGDTGSLSLNNGNIEARVLVVLLVAEVEFTPGAVVSTVGISGERVASGSTPATLRVLVESNVLGRAGGESEADSFVAVPAVELHVGADLVPDGDVPVLGVVAGEADSVLVLGGDILINEDDVAAPWVTDVADVSNVVGGDGGGSGASAEAAGDVGARGRVRVGAGRRGSGSGGLSRRSSDNLGGSNLLGRGSGSSRGAGGSRGLAGVLVDPGDEDTVNGGIDHITDGALGLVVVLVTVVVSASHSGTGADGREGEDGVLELHRSGRLDSFQGGSDRLRWIEIERDGRRRPKEADAKRAWVVYIKSD